MKSALLLTGNLRTFELCIESFNKICEKINPDIFLCISDIQNDLHPYVKQKENIIFDNKLNSLMLYKILSINNNIYNRIKKIILINSEDENKYMETNYLSNIDKTKEWLGLDIFKQYKKRLIGIDLIKNYENDNDIKYEYILNTRFDIMIETNTLPINLERNQIYSSLSGENNHIFLSNQIDNLDKIFNGIIELFFKNPSDKLICQSIHNMIDYVITKNYFRLNRTIKSDLNRNYKKLFDINITLVTCFYNIKRENWNGYSRINDVYFENCKNVLNKKNPIVIYTTENYLENCKEIRKKTDPYLIYTEINIVPFEKLKYYNMHDTIEQIQKDNLINIPEKDRNCPEFCQPKYIIVIYNKTNFLKQVAEKNIFNSKIFQWVDFGLHKNMYENNNLIFNTDYFSNIFYKKNNIKLVGFLPKLKINNLKQFYNSHIQTTCATLFGGDYESIIKLEKLCNEKFKYLIENRLMNQEQYIIYNLLTDYPEMFDYTIMSDWNELCKKYSQNSVNIEI
jgi:hypothetical protein